MKTAVANASTEDEKLSRVERKRRDARTRIIIAAEALMRSQPVDAVTIQDITEAADIGHGTFYLHFKSKYEVLVPIIQQMASDWDAVLQQNLRDVDDPAETLAISTRHMARIIIGDPLWCWFLKHSGVPVEDMREAVGSFGGRDLGKGLFSGRFHLPEVAIGSGFLLGAFVNSLLTSLKADDPALTIDQAVEMILRVLGLDQAEAKLIAHRELEPLIH
jgi:AcrR family transcriptional regulator